MFKRKQEPQPAPAHTKTLEKITATFTLKDGTTIAKEFVEAGTLTAHSRLVFFLEVWKERDFAIFTDCLIPWSDYTGHATLERSTFDVEVRG